MGRDTATGNSVDNQHLAWMARSFGRADYLPLSAADLEVISAVATPVSRSVNSHLFRQGGPATAAFLVTDGFVDLYRLHADRRFVIARVGPGSVMGDIAMFGEGVYLSAAKAVTQVRAMRFDRDRLLPKLAEHPALCLRWLVAGLRQLESAHRRIVRLMHGTITAQVADLILEEATDSGEIRMSQADIAALLGATRQSVNEAVRNLREMGAISTGYRSIVIEDDEHLRRAAGDAVGI